MTLLKVLDKKRNITYVYESKSEWDKEKKQSKSTRKLIGKIDPKTGEIVKTGPRGRKKSRRKTTSEKKPNYKKLYLDVQAEIKEQNDMIIELKTRVADLEIELRLQRGIMSQIRKLAKIRCSGIVGAFCSDFPGHKCVYKRRHTQICSNTFQINQNMRHSWNLQKSDSQNRIESYIKRRYIFAQEKKCV